MIIKSEVVYITPHIASEMLAKNYGKNRKLCIPWVVELARSMKSGDFKSMNGQNRIIVGTDGTLYDGQHRLKAIICSGITLPFEICTSDSAEDDYKTFDYAQVKRTRDFIDGTDKSNRATIAKTAYAIKYGKQNLTTTICFSHLRSFKHNNKTVTVVPTRLEVVEFHNKDSEYFLKITQDARAIRNRLGSGSVNVFGGVIYFLHYIGVDNRNIEMFISEMKSAFPTSKAVQYAQSQIMKAYAAKTTIPTKSFLLTKTLAAYAGFMTGDKVICNAKQLENLMISYDNALKVARERDIDRDENQ